MCINFIRKLKLLNIISLFVLCAPNKVKKCNLIIRGERAQPAIKGPHVARAGAPSTVSALVTLE